MPDKIFLDKRLQVKSNYTKDRLTECILEDNWDYLNEEGHRRNEEDWGF